MTVVLVLIAVLLTLLLVLVTFVQVLHLEALRFRPREMPALVFFKETLEERLKLKIENGVLALSIIKHSMVLGLGIVVLLALVNAATPLWANALEAFLVSWLAMLLTAYIAPQLLYRRSKGHWVLPFIPVLRVLVLAVTPLTFLLGFFQSLATLNDEDHHEEAASSQSDHIDALIAAGTEEGLLEENDRKLIESVVAFGDKTVREVMTPRPQIVAIEENRTLEDLRNLVVNEQYSRLPVYSETIDHITGFVHVRDMFEVEEEERRRRTVNEIVRTVRFVPETKPIHDLLREMQQDGAHLSIVVDEYGNTAGLVTMEDLVEEILGEIRDEHEPALDVTEDPKGVFVVSGSLDLDRLHDLVDFRPEHNTESTTVGGLVTEWAGRVPLAGEAVERDGIRIEVLASDRLRVEQVRVSRSQPERA